MTRRDQTWPATLLLALTPLGAFGACPKRVLMAFHDDCHVPAIRLLEQRLLKP